MLVCGLVGIASFWFLSLFDADMLADLDGVRQPVQALILGLMVSSIAVMLCIPRRLHRNWQYEALTLVNTLAVSGAVIGAGVLSDSFLTLTHTQVLVLVLMYVALTARQRFWWTFLSAALTVAAYALLVRGKAPALQQVVDQNVKLILVAYGYALVFNYLFEYGERRAWLLRQLDAHKRQALTETRDRLSLLSGSDALTGLSNRRRFEEALSQTWTLARAEGQAVAALMIDVDHFKRYNDTYGHPAGDACLARIAAVLASHTRGPHDVVARLGGEEFALLLPQCSADEASAIAQHVCDAVRAAEMEHLGAPMGGCVTVSVGVAAVAADRAEPQALMQAADKALYQAKAQGRDGFQTARINLECHEARAGPTHPDGVTTSAGAASQSFDVEELEAQLALPYHSLRFSPAVEAAYEQGRAPGRRRHLLLMTWFGLFCLNAYAYCSRAMFADVQDEMMNTLMTVTIGLLGLSPVLLTPLPGWLRELLYAEGICAVAAASCVGMANSQQPSAYSFLAWLLFLPLYAGVVGRQSPWHAAVTAAVTIGSALVLLDPRTREQALVMRDSLTIVSMASLYTVVAAYTLNRADRRQWLLCEMERLHQAELEQAGRALRELSMTDPLTGLSNRRQFEAACRQSWAGGQEACLALILVDIDHFKRFNDGYGHPEGDRCLQQVAQTLAEVARRNKGVAARLGGEEFAILLPGAMPEDAWAIAQEARHAVWVRDIEHAFSPTSNRLTVSIGVADAQGLRDTSELLAAADQALYRAKRDGRDRIAGHRPDSTPPGPSLLPEGDFDFPEALKAV